jgi:hypothetical protein
MGYYWQEGREKQLVLARELAEDIFVRDERAYKVFD